MSTHQKIIKNKVGLELAQEFDDALHRVLEPHAHEGRISFSGRTRIEWGRPLQ